VRAAAPLLALAAVTSASGLPAQDTPKWSVETPTGPTRPLSFETTEGTWMSVAISPDGRWLAFDLLGHIYEMPIEGGTARRLTDGRSWNLFPRYSPDGRQIAFSSDRSGSHNIWTMDRQGAALRQFVAAEENVYKPAWSPDGRHLYAGTEGDGVPSQLISYSVLGGRQSLLQGGTPSGAVAEPAGTGVLYERSDRAVYPFGFNPYVIPQGGTRIERYDLGTGESSVVVERPGGAFAPALSPDGRRLAYVNRSIDETILILRELETRRERVLARGLDRDRQDARSGYGPFPTLAWHPDGQRIVIGVGGQLTAIDATTGKPTRIPFRASVRREMSQTLRFKTTEPRGRTTTRAHRWGSRTPRGVLFEALGDLWLAEGSGPSRNLTRSDAHETSPVSDPKTGALYYASWTDDSLGAVYRSDAPGSPGGA
jgi:dipeptidyl aminopeptidase/acylaminoacyl peptidase